ncbi:DUF1186 domain-containing protein [Clostridium sp. WILCCON 0269]|uniref:DUF1186 domain-containing protein n=1 Tax=Candidatus Clostridium eludens TaxID=3381663 RepID=A0ABW8SMI0_9CLOT
MNELLEQIKYINGKFPEEQLRQIINNKEEFIPELLNILKSTKDNYKEILEEPNYFVHIYASYLLSQFKENRGFPLIIDLVSLPDEITYGVFGDVITEDLHRILASVCDGNTEPIKKLLENEDINEYVRIAAIKTFPVLWVEGIIFKDEIVEYYRILFKEKLKRQCSTIWGSLVSNCCKICPDELYEEIKKAYDDELVETFYISLEGVNKELNVDDTEKILNLKNFGYEFIKDTINDLKYWPCFTKEDSELKSQYTKSTEVDKKSLDKKKKKRKQVEASRKKQRKRK